MFSNWIRLETCVAGTGKAGYSGDGGAALGAQLDSPLGLALDLAGNLYIADSSNQRVRRVSPNGAISTVAGTGSAGDSGDNGPATSAQLSSPQSVAVDSAGNLYIADSGNHRVRRVSAGIVTTVAGNGSAGDSGDGNPATNAQLHHPQGVAVDTAGNLYIADSGNNRIRMVSTSGVIGTVAGTGVWGTSADDGAAAGLRLANPGSVAVDSAGNLYIADTGSHRIRQASGGTIGTVAGSGQRGSRGDGGAAVDAQLDSPAGAAVDSAGNLYIADSRNHRVRKVTAAVGGISTVAGSGAVPFSGDAGPASLARFSNQSHRMAVAADPNGNVYFTDNGNHRVRKVAPDGSIATVAGNGAVGSGGDTGPAADAEFDTPAGLATAGNLYIADAGTCRVRKVDTNGVITAFAGTGSCQAGGDGGPVTSASLDPSGLAFDSVGNLYIADPRNNRVRKVSPGGVITTVAGTGTAGYSGDGGAGADAKLSNPEGVAVDSAGNLYIADTSNSVVRELSTGGAIRTIAGTGVAGHTGDGGSATSASLGSPEGVAVDSAGNVFIADGYYATIRKVSTDGVIGTIAGTGVAGYTGDGGPAVNAQLSGPSDIALDAAGNLYLADRLNSAVRILQPEGSRPLLAISSAHSGNFAAGQGAATLSVTVSNAALGSPTSGTVAVAEIVPAGLTLVSLCGAGWTCSGAVCRRGDPLSNGSNYPPILVTVNVAANAPPQVSNVVDVSGGGSVGASAMDAINVTGAQILTVVMTHVGNFAQGQSGGAYSITVTNRGTAATVGTVAVTDALPAGLKATAIGGTGWTCTQATLTCTRSDALPAGGRYPASRVTVNVAADAPASVTNTAAVWGGGAATASVGNPATVVQLTGPGTAPAAGGRKLHAADGVALRITTTGVPAATQYQSYSTTLTATGGTPPYTWSVDPSTGISLPEGMSLDPATGIVSATQVNGQGGYQINAQVTDSSSPAPSVANAILDFGVDSDDSYGGCPMFPSDSIFNQRIDRLPVDTADADQIPSGYLTAPLHPDFGSGYYPGPGGIPFMRVPANQPASNVNLSGDGQIDPAGIYAWPFPPNAVVEGTSYGQYGDDHHILILQTSTNGISGPQTGPCTLFETYQSIAVPNMYDAGSNTWFLAAGLDYHLNSDEIAASTNTLDTGAQDSAGIPILPLLIRYSEVPLGVYHPLRMTFPSPTHSFVWPATGCCGSSGPPQGLLYRLKASVNWQAVCPASGNPQAATVLQALEQYGAYMSDHGSAGYMQGVPDIRWDDNDLACIKQFHVSDLEVVDNSVLEVFSISGQTMPYLAPAALPDGTVGTAYSATIPAVGGAPASRQWSVSSGALPPGLTLDAAAGTIGGTPSSPVGSPFSFGITATDTASGHASQPRTFSIGVTGSGGPPTANLCDVNQDGIVNVSDVQLIVNEALGVAPPVNDINQDGVVNVVEVQLVIHAALGLGCPAS